MITKLIHGGNNIQAFHKPYYQGQIKDVVSEAPVVLGKLAIEWLRS